MKSNSNSTSTKEEIFRELAERFSRLSPKKLKYGEGIVTAYTLLNGKGEEVLELQTDFGDHLDLLVIVGGHPYSLGGSYIHGIENWRKFARQAGNCMQIIFEERMATEEEWFRGGKRVGGNIFIPNAAAKPRFILHDRTGNDFRWFTQKRVSDRVVHVT